MPTRGLDRIEEPVSIRLQITLFRPGSFGEGPPTRLDRRQREGPGTHQHGGIAWMIGAGRRHRSNDTGPPKGVQRGIPRPSSARRSRRNRAFEEPRRPPGRTNEVGTPPFISSGSIGSHRRLQERHLDRVSRCSTKSIPLSDTCPRQSPHSWVEISSPYLPHRGGDGRLMVEIHS